MPTANLKQLETGLVEMAVEQLDGMELQPRIDIDALVRLPEMGGDTYRITRTLAPFGNGNPVPTFLSLGVELLEHRTMGNGEHLRLKLRQGNTVWDSVAIRLANHQDELNGKLDIIYNLEADRWNG